jgi:hypothetical protein
MTWSSEASWRAAKVSFWPLADGRLLRKTAAKCRSPTPLSQVQSTAIGQQPLRPQGSVMFINDADERSFQVEDAI